MALEDNVRFAHFADTLNFDFTAEPVTKVAFDTMNDPTVSNGIMSFDGTQALRFDVDGGLDIFNAGNGAFSAAYRVSIPDATTSGGSVDSAVLGVGQEEAFGPEIGFAFIDNDDPQVFNLYDNSTKTATSGSPINVNDQFFTIVFVRKDPAAWQASTAYNLGDEIRPTTRNDWVYECTVAGTSGSSEPTWPTTEGATVADGGAEWTARFSTKIYVDGAEQSLDEQFLGNSFSVSSATELSIGAWIAETGSAVNVLPNGSQLDWVVSWLRALTDDEIANNMNETDLKAALGLGPKTVSGSGDLVASAATLAGEGTLIRTVTVALSDNSGGAQTSLSNIRWRWRDTWAGSITDSGSAESTDGSGQLVLELSNTTLTSGQSGYAELEWDDGAGNFYTGLYLFTLD